MADTDLHPISLTVLRQQRGLVVSLTDGRSVGRLSTLDVDDAQLAEIEAATALLRSDGGSEAARALGSRIFRQLLAEPVRSFLARCPPRELTLQLAEPLLAIPWELAFDGERFIGEKFRLCRQIVSDEESAPPRPAPPARDELRVLVVATGPDAQALTAALGQLDRLAAHRADALDSTRELEAIGEADIVHCLGPLEPATIAGLAALPSPPQLLVCDDRGGGGGAATALAKAACRAGLNIVACESPAGQDGEFAVELYRALADGAALAEAVRRARSAGDRPGAAPRLAALYGEAARVVFPQGQRPPQADNRRQVTILSFDLVDSTRLLGALGAERYGDLLARYHECCTDIVSRYGGRPEDPQGNDGIMCYFGLTVAHENSAAQALRAGLELIDAVEKLGVQVRVGAVTGEVVVRSGQPVGSAIHFAARLQSIAVPGTPVVSESTRRIVKDSFEFRQLERVPPLKGFDQPGPLYRLLGEAQPDRFDAAPSLAPFVGRAAELQLLEQHWLAAHTALRIVRISGEAGIGKSRLVREFRLALAARQQQALECRCAPEHTASAFYPVIELLRRLLSIRPGDSVERKLDRIEQFLRVDIGVESAPALMAALLSVPTGSRYPPLPGSTERQRQLTVDLLAALMRRQTRAAPACLIVEDIHWIDPSSRELLNRLITEARRSPLLIVVTRRSDAEADWNPAAPVHEIELSGLSPEAARALVVACGDSRLSSELVRWLANRADGVPLFIEESTRMAIELGAGKPGAEAASRFDLEVPATIHDLLMARLDRLGNAKQIAQVGGAIGREFPLPLLQAVLANETCPFRISNVAAHLARLVASGMLIEKSGPPEPSCLFRHALVRDAAYRSMLERDRRKLHRVIAIVIGEQFAELAESRPELLAWHYTEAGLDAEAVQYWERAARLDASRSAHYEAISHLTSGLAVVQRLPRDAERDRTELRMQLLLAGRFIATDGYGADRVERAYTRAAELCGLLGDESSLLKVQLGLEGYHFMRGNFAQAQAIAAKAAAIAERSGDSIHALQSTWAIANILFHRGELAAAVAKMDDCLAGYEKLQHRPSAVQDPGVMCLCYSAWGMWELGYPDQALQRALRVVDLAEKMQHTFSMGEAYGFRTTVHHFRGETDEALRCAGRAIEICEDGGFAVWLAHARLMHGRLRIARGDEAGIDEMRTAYELWAATGAVVTRPFYLAMRAEGLALVGRPDEGLLLLDEAMRIVGRTGERYYEAEARRLTGELMLQSAALHGGNRDAEAESWLQGALDCARSQQLRSLVLRAAMSLARLRLARGRAADPQGVFEPAFRWFSEGTGTADLMAARSLLQQIKTQTTAEAARG